jgi:hypothetical protein
MFTVHKGIRGQHTRVYNPDRQATLVIELLPTSVANDVFTSIVIQDTEAQTGLLNVSLKDTSGTSKFTTSSAYLRTLPDLSFNAEGVTTRKWEIEILSFVTGSISVGGNASNGIDITDILSGAAGKLSGLVKDGMGSVASYFS